MWNVWIFLEINFLCRVVVYHRCSLPYRPHPQLNILGHDGASRGRNLLPGRLKVKLAKLLGQLHWLADDALDVLVVPHLHKARQREVLKGEGGEGWIAIG